MPSINNAVQKQATRLNISLEQPLDDVAAKKIQAALSDAGVDATLGEIKAARDEVHAAGVAAVQAAGDGSSALRNATAGSANTAGSPSSSVGVRAGNVAIFDAAAALKAAIGKEAAAGGLQWSEAETMGPSMGSPKRRWIPSETELAQMDKKPLKELIGGTSDTSVYWPKNAAERAPGTKIFLEKAGPFGPEYASVSLRAEAPAPSAPAEKPSASTRKTVMDALKAAGLSGNPIVHDRSIEVFMMSGFKEARAALIALGFKEEQLQTPYSGTVYNDPKNGVSVQFLKDEMGGGV